MSTYIVYTSKEPTFSNVKIPNLSDHQIYINTMLQSDWSKERTFKKLKETDSKLIYLFENEACFHQFRLTSAPPGIYLVCVVRHYTNDNPQRCIQCLPDNMKWTSGDIYLNRLGGWAFYNRETGLRIKSIQQGLCYRNAFTELDEIRELGAAFLNELLKMGDQTNINTENYNKLKEKINAKLESLQLQDSALKHYST